MKLKQSNKVKKKKVVKIKIIPTRNSRSNFNRFIIEESLKVEKVWDKLRVKNIAIINWLRKPISKNVPVLFGNMPLVEIVEKAKHNEVNALFPADIIKMKTTAVKRKYNGKSSRLYFNSLSSEFFVTIILVAKLDSELERKISNPPRFIGSRIANAITKKINPPSQPTRARQR